jgi:hypothetical protein
MPKYKILHLPTATYMYHSLGKGGKTDTRNFYTQFEVDNKFYDFSDYPATQLFNSKSTATRFLDRWELLATLENNDGVDDLVFEDNEEYKFKRIHFSVIRVEDEKI